MVWVFHGLYSKLLEGIPRHRQIVERVLGEELAGTALVLVALGEIALGLWMMSGRWRIACALVQTLALLAMNTLEIALARDLLISAPGMLFLNVLFLTAVWLWARARPLPKTSAR